MTVAVKKPKKLSKRKQKFLELSEPGKVYQFDEAVSIIKEVASLTNFQESMDVAIKLGVDPRKSDQVVRSSTVMPNGTGRTMRVAVFAQGANAEKAKEAGADLVGFEDLAATIKEQAAAGKIEFDVIVATPDAMRIVGQLGRILGPRNLMPNPKLGTVTADVTKAVNNAKSGQVSYRTDKSGIIHCTIGKTGFDGNALKENLEALIEDLKKIKPSTAKGVYLSKIVLSSTMGPGLIIDISSF